VAKHTIANLAVNGALIAIAGCSSLASALDRPHSTAPADTGDTRLGRARRARAAAPRRQQHARAGRNDRGAHNKSLTADNQATIFGGRNVGDEYFGAESPVASAPSCTCCRALKRP